MICALMLMAGLTANAIAAGPVTDNDLRQTMYKADKALSTVLKLNPPSPVEKGTSQPATRAQIIAEFDRIFEKARPKFRMTPRPYRVEKEAITKHNSGKTAETLEKLIRWGVVGPVGPLVVGPTDTLTPQQYGDALGLLFVQLASLTHTPSLAGNPAIKY